MKSSYLPRNLEPKKAFFTDQILTRKISGTPKYFKLLQKLLQTSGSKHFPLSLRKLMSTFMSASLISEDFALFLMDLETYAKSRFHLDLKKSIMLEAFFCYR